jgi:hypothetical protein
MCRYPSRRNEGNDMAKATHVLTGPASKATKALTGNSTESVSVYGSADLGRRTAAAKAAGVAVTVKSAK